MIGTSPAASLDGVEARLGPRLFEARLSRQADLWARKVHQGEGLFRLERFLPMDDVIRLALRASGLYGRAHREFLDIAVVEREVVLPRLPAAFNGFRLLQLADLHCDIDERFVETVIAALDGIDYDRAVLTGDYHNKIGTCYRGSLEAMSRLVPHLKPGALAILGNHDFIEKVGALEASGLTVLLNESVAIERRGAVLWVCGVDDPHFFRTDDLERSRAGVRDSECAILLSHSPETYEAAAALGFDLLLCGHTHGGQLCLPGGVPVYRNARVPARLLSGAWRWGRMQGYTSRGTGSCGVPARLFCRPEITVHVLRSP